MSISILIIDDFALEVHVMGRMVQRAVPDARIMPFSSSPAALEYLDSIKYSAYLWPRFIFLDLHMPILNGFDFMHVYREFPEKVIAQCSVIMISASNKSDDYETARQDPLIREIFCKPIGQDRINNLLAPRDN